MMKPLEPGCLAYVHGGPDAGITVTCVYYAPPGFKYLSTDGRKQETIVPAWIVEHPDGVQAIHAERDLVRIDGGDSEACYEEKETALC